MNFELTVDDLLSVVLREELKPIHRSVLLSLFDFFKVDGVINPSLETLAKKANCTKPTLVKALNYLKEIGYVIWKSGEFFTDQNKTSNEYEITVKELNPNTVKKLNPIVNYNTFNTFNTKEPKGPIGTMEPISPMDPIGDLGNIDTKDTKGGEREMKQRNLFSKPKTKKEMSEEELYQGAMNGTVKLNYTEVKRVYNHLHRKVYGKMCTGRMRVQDLQDLFNTLGDHDLDESTFWQVLPSVFEQYRENTEAPYVSPWMLMGQKEARKFIQEGLDRVENDKGWEKMHDMTNRAIKNLLGKG